MLSVLLVTNRPGGLDVVTKSLREQTDQGFELIVMDDLKLRRLGSFRGVANTWHLGPTAPIWGTYMYSLNRCLEFARGDVVLFISDYTHLAPDCIAGHRAFHATHEPQDVALGPIEYTALPELHPDFPRRYGWSAIGHDPANYSDATYAPWLDFKRRHELYEEWRENYERDLESGLLAPFMFSTFAKPYAGTEGLKVWERNERTPPSQFMNLKNDSMRRELLDGFRFDERADGTHGHQDSITHRQLAKRGARFIPGGGSVKNLDPHGIAIIRRKGLNDEANLKLAEAEQ